jgi:hypothetical protein
VKGEGLWWELRGESVLPIQTERPAHKCLSRGGSLGGATDDLARLRAWVIRNVERMIEELDFHQVRARRITLSLQSRDRTGIARRVTLPQPTHDFDTLAAAGLALFSSAWSATGPQLIGYMHLDADLLEHRRQRQTMLFDGGDDRAAAVARVKQQVNQKLGRFALRSAATLPIEDVYADPMNDFDICDVHGKICF